MKALRLDISAGRQIRPWAAPKELDGFTFWRGSKWEITYLGTGRTIFNGGSQQLLLCYLLTFFVNSGFTPQDGARLIGCKTCLAGMPSVSINRILTLSKLGVMAKNLKQGRQGCMG